MSEFPDRSVVDREEGCAGFPFRSVFQQGFDKSRPASAAQLFPKDIVGDETGRLTLGF
jgi:hypothetical protein